MPKLTIEGAVARAVTCVQRNLPADYQGSPNGPTIEHICQWAVGAAVRYIRDQPEPGEKKKTRVNEPVQAATDLGGDPKDIAKAKGFTGDMCTNCGGLNMVRTGTCATCQDCGGTSGGCS